jgi:hypothetical protein
MRLPGDTAQFSKGRTATRSIGGFRRTKRLGRLPLGTNQHAVELGLKVKREKA